MSPTTRGTITIYCKNCFPGQEFLHSGSSSSYEFTSVRTGDFRETDLPISGYRLGLYRLPFLSFPRVTLDSVPRGTFISSSTKDSKLLRQKDTAFG